ncbi:hypothetical protein GCM10009789_20300 [Kribbella sancticallisti]|uniref:Uncharacterized protein n=1 Tax=Kribbella sancticallisti TaxID=460087 RepID=A0ABN2D175_9ACTN
MTRRSSAPLDLADVYAERLGVEPGEGVRDELQARFEHLSRFLLTGGMSRQGKAGAVSAEAATAYGDLWVLTGFLADARTALTGSEGTR